MSYINTIQSNLVAVVKIMMQKSGGTWQKNGHLLFFFKDLHLKKHCRMRRIFTWVQHSQVCHFRKSRRSIFYILGLWVQTLTIMYSLPK